MNLRPAQLLRGLAVVAFLVAWALLAHFGSAGQDNPNLATLLGVAPICAAIGLMLWRASHPLITGSGVVLLIGALAWYWPQLRQNIALLFFIQHLGTNLALGTLFGRSLLGDGEALITQLSRAVHQGELSERKRRYTRQATLAWTIFFLTNALLSTGLWVFAPLSAWSVYANLLSMPLLAAMFIAEHFWRVHALLPKKWPSIAQVIRAYRLQSQTHNPPGKPT